MPSVKAVDGRPRARGGGGGVSFIVGFLMVIALLMGIASLVASHHLRQRLLVAYAILERQDQDIASMGESLQIATENTSASGAEIDKQIATLFSEVDKLWASAWRVNKAKIAALEEAVARADQSQAGYRERIEEALDSIEEVLGTKGLAEVIGRVRDLDALVRRLESDKQLVQERLRTNEEWVNSINEWRREYNQRLLRLQDLVNSSNRSATSDSGGGFEETPL